jgi:hypothetical protein
VSEKAERVNETQTKKMNVGQYHTSSFAFRFVHTLSFIAHWDSTDQVENVLDPASLFR